MTILIWGGAAITLLGFLGILWSVMLVSRARRARLDDDALRARIQTAMPVNIGALLLSMFGLMMVIVGVILA